MLKTELQTERLRQETGAQDIDCNVLLHDLDQKNRLVVLSSVHREGEGLPYKVPQAVAYSSLSTHDWTPEIETIDTRLAQGDLMGETFRAENIPIRQNRLFQTRLPLQNENLAALYNVPVGTLTEVKCYEFWAGMSQYAVVLEIRNPRRAVTPHYPHVGSEAICHALGVSRKQFIAWLDDPECIEPRYYETVKMAQMAGLKTGWQLYKKAIALWSDHSKSLEIGKL